MNVFIELSVHDLVDFLLRKGDIDTRIFNKSSMAEGTKIHAFWQKKAGNDYLAEYPLEVFESYAGFDFKVSGRADGIIIDDDVVTIDEIKSYIGDIDEFYLKNQEWHLGQAKVYAYMYMKEKNLNKINILLTYISQEDRHNKYHSFTYSFVEIRNYFFHLLDEYIDFYDIVKQNLKERDESIKDLDFPYIKMRKYQSDFCNYVNNSVIDKENIMIEAPTGIGKTISVLLPHIKNYGPDLEKIFFATAKNSGKIIVKKTIESLIFKGLKARSVLLTSKENICPLKDQICNPDKCPFAKSYYDKIKNVLTQILASKQYIFDKDLFTSISQEYEICPFELQLDLSSFSDLIVCDYNYIFDPFVKLQRYLENNCKKYSLLIDEGHNLVPRGRKMYTASVSFAKLKEARKSIRKEKFKNIKTSLSKLNAAFSKSLLEQKEKIIEVKYFDETLMLLFSKFLSNYQDLLKNKDVNFPKPIQDFYLDVFRFSKIYELINEDYVCFIKKDSDEELELNIFCIRPTSYISSTINSFRNVALFSATLSPNLYFRDVIFNNDEKVEFKAFPSPFDEKNFNLLIAPKISFKYKDRVGSINDVTQMIAYFVNAKIGNYLLFVPSYEYINLLKNNLNLYGCNIFYQFAKMSEEQKKDFLNNLAKNPDKTTVCVAVLGGIFSESIDLVGDMLIGVIVLGVGFPQINFENEKIKNYYDLNNEKGFSYAYLYPGMNAVTQAVGRLLRSESDYGSVLLVDSRYMQKQYLNLFPKNWSNYKVVTTPFDVSEYLTKFYDKHKEI